MTHVEPTLAAPMPPSSIDFAQVFAEQAERSARIDELRPANRDRLFEGLSAAGITHVTVTFDGEGDSGQIESIAAWAGEIDHAIMWGNRITTEVVFFHRQSGTAIFTDLIQQFPRGWFKGWRALIARLDLMTAAEPTVPRKFRVAFTDRRAARESLRRILAWPTEKVIIAHGPPITDDGQAFLRRAFRWLAD